jgi:xylulokinase
MGEEEASLVFQKTGNRLFAAGVMAPALCWMRDTFPDYGRIKCFLYSNGFLAARLTGRFIIDACRASVSLLHDPRQENLVWQEELCDLFGLQQSLLPEIVPAWEVAGTITAEAAAQTGLPAGIPVMAGAVDSLCAALGSGITTSQQVLDIGGSAGGLTATFSKPVPSQRTYLFRYVLPGIWCSSGPLEMGSRLFPWFVEHFAHEWTMDQYFQEIKKTPPLSGGIQFLPYVGGARHPYWTTGLSGHFLDIPPEGGGLPFMARAVMEGLACAHRRIMDDLRKLGAWPEHIIAAGGDSTSEEWLQTKANFMQISYLVSDVPERSARGAALLAANYLGLTQDFAHWPSKTTRQVNPLQDPILRDAYEAYYEQFLKYCELLYPKPARL